MAAFGAQCEPFAPVDILEMAAWIAAISLSDWPQQKPVDDQLRPAMVTDLSWHGFGFQASKIISGLMEYLPGSRPYQTMLSVVMPGHRIEAHRDEQADYWQTRIHVPLLSNPQALFVSRGIPFVMAPGLAYFIDTTVDHAIENKGSRPRAHLMFDVRGV